MAKDNPPEACHYVEMAVAMNVLAKMKWLEPKQNDINTMTFRAGPAGIKYEVSRYLSGWTAKLSIRANRILIYEAHVSPRQVKGSHDLMNAWDIIANKMFDVKEGVTATTRILAQEDIRAFIDRNHK
jgi:hypothetical protein